MFSRCNTRNKQTPTHPKKKKKKRTMKKKKKKKKKKTLLISKESLLETRFVFASQLLFVLSQLI